MDAHNAKHGGRPRRENVLAVDVTVLIDKLTGARLVGRCWFVPDGFAITDAGLPPGVSVFRRQWHRQPPSRRLPWPLAHGAIAGGLLPRSSSACRQNKNSDPRH